MNEYMKLLVQFWDENVDKIFPKEKTQRIAKAVVELLRQCDRIETFHKKNLYLCIREISGCHTFEITKVINQMIPYMVKSKKYYRDYGTVPLNYQDYIKIKL